MEVSLTIPLVNASQPGGFTGTTLAVGQVTPTFERSFTSYDGQIGGRLHIRNGAWSYSPGFYLGYQRTNLDESVGIINAPILPSVFRFNLNSSVASDYYQVGLALGGTYAMSAQWSLYFGSRQTDAPAEQWYPSPLRSHRRRESQAIAARAVKRMRLQIEHDRLQTQFRHIPLLPAGARTPIRWPATRQAAREQRIVWSGSSLASRELSSAANQC